MVAFFEPGDEPTIWRGRGQPSISEACKDLLQQDRHRPAVEHDVVSGEYESVLVVSDTNQGSTEGRLVR